MLMVETAIFTRQIQDELSDDQYRALQGLLIADPKIGKIIPGSGGLRKLRFGRVAKGKRGGLRIIYHWHGGQDMILMLFVYPKNVRSDLSRDQLRTLKRMVDREYP